MTDHVVALSPILAPDVRATVATLALAGAFALPGTLSATALESDLLHRFATATQVTPADVTAWLTDGKAEYHDLADVVAQFGSNPVALHTALQQQNDAGGLVLLRVSNAGSLTEATTGAGLHPNDAGAVWLLRSGYADDPPLAYYYDLGATHLPQPIKILWQTVASAGIEAAIALDAPKPPIDVAGATDALHIMEQALATAKAAHGSILTALGL